MKRILAYIFVALALLLFVQQVEAQVSELPKVSGLVLEKGTGKRISDVNVVNTRTKRVVFTNAFGVFYIEAAVGDTLSITKVGYGPLKTVIYSNDDILLEMQPGIMLEEVVIARRSKRQDMEDILRDYSKKGIYNGGKNNARNLPQ
ncbi:carboxypeptidase-like regulatory domain-containing protein [Sphingobacterium sp. T2]|uniref:carboxypeptidase-like regulatory domain-containing protein n=1 Tax=Sphingobacterium sp. T2 TaxID=1590596 RepID=UPI001E429FD5|nr:carboxypeptidase-like regulatory domain-containing protein [Sphingobacterium sp. T2]